MQHTAACHLLSTAEVAASSSSAAVAAINHLGQSKILHLLGPAWTRTFRCVWMLEEINEEYYQQKNSASSSKTRINISDTVANDSLHLSSSTQQQIPYYLLYNAKPLSMYVKKYHPTGKVPVLLEYDDPQYGLHTKKAYKNEDVATIANGDSQLDEQNVFVLSESSAINTYLYDRYGLCNTRKGIDTQLHASSVAATTTEESSSNDHHPLVPPVGSPLRGQYDALLSCICTELDAQGLWIHRKHEAMAEQLTGSRPNHGAVYHAKNHFKRINAYLAYRCNPYLLGSHFTAADILYVHCLQWSQSIGWSTDTWPTIHVLPPINVDVIKEKRKKQCSAAAKDGDESANYNDDDSTPPSILQPYLDLCISRPAYRRAVQIRDGNTRKSSQTNTDTTSNPTIATTSDQEPQQQTLSNSHLIRTSKL